MDQMLVVSLILFSVSQLFQIMSPCNVSSFSTSVFSHVSLVCSTNLIEFILVLQKLQREMEKNGKSQRKKERREIKGQGRKEKDTLHNVKSLDDKKSFQQKKGKKGEAKGWCPQKIEHEAEQLERSDITNEHGLPTFIENNSYLSDGTQSSKKSKPLIVRIKLLKHSEPDASLACSPSGRVDLLPPERTEVVLAPSQPSAETNVELRQVSSKPDQDLPCSTSERIETIGQKRSASAAFEDQIESEDSLHATLIENWIPPPIQFADVGDGDEEWLFGTKHQNRCGSKRFKAANNEVSSCTRSTPWPQAQWLLEAGVYALPFTVPL